MANKSWRDDARPIIRKVLQETEGKTEKEVRKSLKEAYPYGQRSMHPYKIWCDEINVQLGKRRFGIKNVSVPKEQQSLF